MLKKKRLFKFVCQKVDQIKIIFKNAYDYKIKMHIDNIRKRANLKKKKPKT